MKPILACLAAVAVVTCGKGEVSVVASPADVEVMDADAGFATAIDIAATPDSTKLDSDNDDGDASDADAGITATDDLHQEVADAVRVPPAPTACAQDPLIDTPIVDAPCKTEGQRRCSQVGTKPYVGSDGLCLRPNLLECTSGVSGLAWKLRSCNEAQKQAVGEALWDKCHYATSVCFEYKQAAICLHPGLLSEEMAKIGNPKGPAAQLCSKKNLGNIRCLSGGTEGQCQQLSGGKFQGPVPRLLSEGYPLDYCAPLGEGGTYNVATKWCPVEYSDCAGMPGYTYKGKCRLHSDGKERCDQNCEEAKESGPPFKTP